MAKLTTTARNNLPKTAFGLPSRRAYPIPNVSHAVNAKARATQMVKAGKLSKASEAKIDAKANRVIKRGK